MAHDQGWRRGFGWVRAAKVSREPDRRGERWGEGGARGCATVRAGRRLPACDRLLGQRRGLAAWPDSDDPPIGATLPVSFSFAIAPLVFVFLHIYTLARYDMLTANVRQFLGELHRTVLCKADRERCRQLLANVEFIQALIAPPRSRLYSPVWRWLVRAVVAVFPIVVLLLVQINALRYQSELITRVQQVGVLLDLSALVWFFQRASLDGSASQRESRLVGAIRWAKLVWLPAGVMGLNFYCMNVVPAEADAGLVRYDGQPEATREYLTRVLRQPLDAAVCPSLKWGCRYLRVDHRTLVDHVWDDKAMADLRRGGADQAKLAAIEGLVLRDRSLRFSVLDESSLFAADLIRSDLRKASLQSARLLGAKLSVTQLQGASLVAAQLQGADLNAAQLQGADLRLAQLQGASLIVAQLQGAELLAAQLQGADLKSAQLQGADLNAAQLQGANLNGAQLQGADLTGAQLQGAWLSGAQLQGAELNGAQLQGADLSGTQLWRARFSTGTALGLSDLRWADFTPPLLNSQVMVHAALDATPEVRWKADAERRLGTLLAADQSGDQLRFTASPERQVLVSDPKDPVFANIATEWLIMSPTPAYTNARVALLAGEIASGDPVVANAIALRAVGGISDSDDGRRLLYSAAACGLLANARAEKVKLEQRAIDLLSEKLPAAKFECESAKPVAPH
jgi:uncharacterized protein YjbI with pentapeptide repeats